MGLFCQLSNDIDRSRVWSILSQADLLIRLFFRSAQTLWVSLTIKGRLSKDIKLGFKDRARGDFSNGH